MRLANLVGSLAFGVTLIGAAATANAQERRNALPMNYIDRPLTLPMAVMRPEADLQFRHIPDLPADSTRNSMQPHLNIGAAIGVTSNFELRSTFLPIRLSNPGPQYGSPSFEGTVRFARGRFDMGARMKVTLNMVKSEQLLPGPQPGTNIKRTGIALGSTTFEPGVPLLLRFNHRARIDTGLFLPITVAGNKVDSAGRQLPGEAGEGYTMVGLNVPVDMTFALGPVARLGIGSGLRVDDFADTSNTITLPLKLFAGFSVGTRRHPFFDIEPYISWDHFLTPGQSAPATQPSQTAGVNNGEDIAAPTPLGGRTATNRGPAQTFHPDAWTLGVNFKGYLHFMR